MLVVALVVALVSVADLVAAVMINSFAAALMAVILCVLGLILLIIDSVREQRDLDTRPAPTEQVLPVEHRVTAGDQLFAQPEVARDIAREERVVSRDMLGYVVPREEVLIDIFTRRNVRH